LRSATPLVALAWLAVPWALPARAASIEELGTLPGGHSFESTAEGVSADGHVVVGTATHVTNVPEIGQIRDDEAFRSEDGVMTGLASLVPGHVRSLGQAASADGSVVVGIVYTAGPTSDPRHGFRWDASGVQLLPDIPGGSDSSAATGVSADGGIVVGAGSTDPPSGTTPVGRAVWWEDGVASALPLASGRTSSSADVSADGSVIFGTEDSPGQSRAASWTNALIRLLPQPLSGSFPRVHGAASNGRIAVGQVNLASGSHPIRWIDASRFELLGRLPQWSFGARAFDASADGSVIVGSGTTASITEAFVWDAYHGLRRLDQVLADAGVDVSGWTLLSASDVSGDGLTIVGAGWSSRPRGFVARLDPTACSNGVDDDGDGAIDSGADIGCLGPLDPDERPDCSDGLDNDGDGEIDFPDDLGCAGTPWISERPACSNGIDDDGDGAIDFGADPQCGSAWAVVENPASGGCGLGAEIALSLGLLARCRRRIGPPERCAGGAGSPFCDPAPSQLSS